MKDLPLVSGKTTRTILLLISPTCILPVRRHDMFSKNFTTIIIFVLTSFALSGCQKKTVIMEYDQSMNFYEYELGKEKSNGYLNPHFQKMIIADHGVFLIYQICSIQNDETDAEVFNFDLSKFYVVHNGKKYYHVPLQQDQFKTEMGSPVHFSVIDSWQEAFKYGVQTAPDHKTISPHLENILSVSWRFHIWVGEVVWLNEFETKRFDLRYDNSVGKESLILLSRGHDPIYKKDTKRDDLPVSCRTAK